MNTLNTRTTRKTQAPRDRFSPIAAALLILLWAYAAVSKLLDFDQFRGELLNQAIPRETAYPLSWLLPLSELSAAALLLFPKTEYRGFLLSALLLTLFSGYIALVLLGFWERIPCSCGGVLRHLGWGPHLVFNLAFLALSLAGVLQNHRRG
ncbi:MauE/DoxX family redox-associated membrane protein [Mucilaginibacter ginsenosidivorans]|uniref:Methylamine utilisation protein MauE domain-containing protein n=1 Tax=Mucilaginibacter ginsenosidivorans TaxID=398053 RepID=A0A5B8UUE7_9SPHI|nr:hypothetical protein FRZ54_07980 [Mucilaginibacter ginsenosidivorans]